MDGKNQLNISIHLGGLGKTTVTLDQYCMAVEDKELMKNLDNSVNKLRSRSVEDCGDTRVNINVIKVKVKIE